MSLKHSLLLEIVQNKVPISESEIETLTSAFHLVSKKKNEFLVKEASSSSNLYFIVQGYIRSYTLVDDGNEITNQLSTSKDFVTSFDSFLHNEATKENIQCITDCTLLSISKEDYESLFNEIANWSLFCKGVYEGLIMKISERASSLQNLSASDRYMKILKTQPDIALNTPVKHLASYLGIKTQSLSRIRKEIK
jgi:CRP-like cAMP-binding protein